VKDWLNNACVPNAMASTAIEISVRSGQEALKRSGNLEASPMPGPAMQAICPWGQVQAGVARTQAALQSLTQLAKSVKSR